MNNSLKNTLAVLAGLIIGSIASISLITISGHVIPPPEGVDMSTMEGLKNAMHVLEPKHYIFPFLAHSLGTLFGCMMALMLCKSRPQLMSYNIAGFFLLGGISNVMMLPSPFWFNALDLIVAYIPMGYLALRIIDKPLSD